VLSNEEALLEPFSFTSENVVGENECFTSKFVYSHAEDFLV